MKPKLPADKKQGSRITYRLKDWVINEIELSGKSRSEFSRLAVEKEALKLYKARKRRDNRNRP